MPRISNRGLGRRRTGSYSKQGDGRSPDRGQDNETRGRRNQPIPIPQTTWTVIDGLGGTGTRIAALLAQDEAKKLSGRSDKSEKKTR